MDPARPVDQARALAATRRILARIKLEILGDDDAAAPGAFTEEDRELLDGDTAHLRREDLQTFAKWHQALGTDPDAALDDMRQRAYERAYERAQEGPGGA